MKLTKTLPYYLKCALPILGLAGATMFTSCEKEEPMPTRDIEFKFSENDLTNLTYFALEKAAAQPDVRYVYMVPVGYYNHWNRVSIRNFRMLQLEPRIELSPKIRGRGNFDFEPGEASKVPEDSLWYVQNGWTINAQLATDNQR